MILDAIRSQLLCTTLRVPAFAEIYCSRERRTLTLYALSLFFNSILIKFSPRVAFYAGPLILGVPHLLFSFQYTVKGFALRRLSLLVLVVTLLKVIEYWFEFPLYHFPEALALTGTGFLLGQKRSSLFLIPLFIISFNYFSVLPLVLLIGHNFVAFYFWWKESRTDSEKRVVINALYMLILVSMVHIFLGPKSEKILSLVLLGDLEGDSFLKIFLLSQSAHYFIWMKAIPDFRQTSPTPTSFRYTFVKIKSEVGKHALKIVGLGSILLLLLFVIIDEEEARIFYLHVSAFHGLSEIGAFMALVFNHKGKS